MPHIHMADTEAEVRAVVDCSQRPRLPRGGMPSSLTVSSAGARTARNTLFSAKPHDPRIPRPSQESSWSTPLLSPTQSILSPAASHASTISAGAASDYETFPLKCFQSHHFRDCMAVMDSVFRQAYQDGTFAYSPLQASLTAPPLIGKQDPATPLHLPTPERVLEIGCGNGAWLLEQARVWPCADFTGLDLQQPLLPFDSIPTDVANRIHLVKGNFLDALPFEHATFDYVFVRLCSYGIPEQSFMYFIEEASRVCAADGFIEISDFNHHSPMVHWQEKQDMEVLIQSPQEFAQRAFDAALSRRFISTTPNAQLRAALALFATTRAETRLFTLADLAPNHPDLPRLVRASIAKLAQSLSLADLHSYRASSPPGNDTSVWNDAEDALRGWTRSELECSGIASMLPSLDWECKFDQETQDLLKAKLDLLIQQRPANQSQGDLASSDPEIERHIRILEQQLKETGRRLAPPPREAWETSIEFKSVLVSPIKD